MRRVSPQREAAAPHPVAHVGPDRGKLPPEIAAAAREAIPRQPHGPEEERGRSGDKQDRLEIMRTKSGRRLSQRLMRFIQFIRFAPS